MVELKKGGILKQSYWVIIIVIILMLAGIWIYYFYSQGRKTATAPSPAPSPSLTHAIGSSPQNSPTIASSPSAASNTRVKIFMIAEGDNGATGKLVGCGDSAVGVEREVPQTEAVLKAAMEQLISIKDPVYGVSGLTNPLAQSSLNFVSASIDNGKATVKFTGSIVLPGDCADTRVLAQFEQTARQFSTVQSVDILINDQNLRDLINQAG